MRKRLTLLALGLASSVAAFFTGSGTVWP